MCRRFSRWRCSMAEYIEKQVTLDAILSEPPEAHYPSWYAERIEALPADDVAPVVRCKDCQRWDTDPDTYGSDYGPKGLCRKFFETTTCDDFCSYGESADEGANNG